MKSNNQQGHCFPSRGTTRQGKRARLISRTSKSVKQRTGKPIGKQLSVEVSLESPAVTSIDDLIGTQKSGQSPRLRGGKPT